VFYYIIKVAYIFFCFENTQGSNIIKFINTVRFKQLQFYNWNVTLLNVHNMCLCWERLENWKTFKQHLCLCLRKVGDLIKIQATSVAEKTWKPQEVQTARIEILLIFVEDPHIVPLSLRKVRGDFYKLSFHILPVL